MLTIIYKNREYNIYADNGVVYCVSGCDDSNHDDIPQLIFKIRNVYLESLKRNAQNLNK